MKFEDLRVGQYFVVGKDVVFYTINSYYIYMKIDGLVHDNIVGRTYNMERHNAVALMTGETAIVSDYWDVTLVDVKIPTDVVYAGQLSPGQCFLKNDTTYKRIHGVSPVEGTILALCIDPRNINNYGNVCVVLNAEVVQVVKVNILINEIK